LKLPKGPKETVEAEKLKRARRILQALQDGADTRAITAEYGSHAFQNARRMLKRAGELE
jgi:hypothetical protein